MKDQNNKKSLYWVIGILTALLITFLIGLNLYQYYYFQESALKYHQLKTELGVVSKDESLGTELEGMDLENLSALMSEQINEGKVYGKLLPLCENYDKSRAYGFESILEYLDGRVGLIITEDAHVDSSENSYIKACRVELISKPNSAFADGTVSLSADMFYPYLNLLVVSELNLETNGYAKGFYSLDKNEVYIPDLPEIVQAGAWFDNYFENDMYGYLLFYPSVLGGCGLEEDGDKCMENLGVEMQKSLDNNPILLYRSDGKLVKLLDKSVTNDLKLIFDYDQEKEEYIIKLTSNFNDSVYFQGLESDLFSDK